MRAFVGPFLAILIGGGWAFQTTEVSAKPPQILSDPVANEECGACHMPYLPRFLPKRSWKRIMADLENHFGEDASLDPKTRERIAVFYDKFGSEGGDNALRITRTVWWRRAHRYEIPDYVWSKVSRADCLACHRLSRRGSYDDD